MPELPDIDAYVVGLEGLLRGRQLRRIRIASPFLLRSVSPAPADTEGHCVTAVQRIGKRIVIGLDNGIWIVLHLMIAGRLKWLAKPPSLTARNRLASIDFEHGSLLLTEAGTKKRASLHIVGDDAALGRLDPGGIEPLTASPEAFRAALTRNNHTLKRALTDPRILSGIGNAYSDEILHAARLSPVQLTRKLDDAQLSRLYAATRETLGRWRQRVLDEASGGLPEKVSAFRDGMKVHGRFGKPCPDCGEPVQRIRYKDNETNYCARCQTGARILKDRSLSRLLKADWPKTLDEL